MPVVHVTTKSSNSVWKSPDGQREIFDVVLDYKGTALQAKTYSNDISTVGWEGDVESYEKVGKPGMPTQTFVKQPAKEYSPGSGKPDTRGYQNSKGQGDQFTMFLSYAKDLAIASITDKGTFNDKMYAGLLDVVAAGGVQLYENRPGAVAPTAPPATEPEAPIPEGDPALEQISAVFGDVENVTPEQPWTPSPK